MFAVSISVSPSQNSTSYCRESNIRLLLGRPTGWPSTATALLLTCARCRSSFGPRGKPNSICRYGSWVPILLSWCSVVPSLCGSASSSITRVNSSINARPPPPLSPVTCYEEHWGWSWRYLKKLLGTWRPICCQRYAFAWTIRRFVFPNSLIVVP
jgi:hypothetical protein